VTDGMDLFDGFWTFSAPESRLAGPAPREWSQQIDVSGNGVQVVEGIVLADGTTRKVTVDASFDGTDSPISGAPLVDTIAYTRPADDTILGCAKRAGRVVFDETVTVSRDRRTLTMALSIVNPEGGRTLSVAVFHKAPSKLERSAPLTPQTS
jgi:hypothetical protein